MEARQLYLTLIFATLPRSAGVAWLVVKISRLWNWRPPRTYSVLSVTWSVYRLWTSEAEGVSGFRPQGWVVWLQFAVSISAVILTVALGTKLAFGKLLWTAPDREPTLLGLELNKPEVPPT
jgi:hypothetical protein